MASGMPEAAICVQDIDVQCVLQFTLIHAAGCALHRHTSRVIHRLELSDFLFRNVLGRQSAKNDSKVIKIKNVKNESRQKLGRSNSVDSLNLAQIALIDGKGVTGDKGTLQICLSHKIRFGRSQRSTIL